MSIHIAAKPGQIAETVLLAGDPLRAKFIADNYLEKVTQYNTVRNMLGFTGYTLDNRKVSVQGSGMGMPSLAIYVNELIDSYKVKKIIRVGSCGSLQPEIKLQDIILAMGSCSDSALNVRRFVGLSFAPLADWDLLWRAYQLAQQTSTLVRVGNIFATDKFYDDCSPSAWEIFAQYKVLAIEMETAELYTLAAQKNIQALSILTVSDSLVTKQSVSALEREQSFTEMIELALQLF